jgi:G3E family GTPase
MKVAIVYGFLGAGKTSLIRHLLDTSAVPGEVAVLVNDFGRVNVDAAALAHQHVQVVALASGCICCSLSGAFVPAVEEICSHYQPKWLIIEPTGVAAPYALEAQLDSPRLVRVATLACVLTVVDAFHFLDYQPKLGEFFTDQIQQADVVVLNKCDLASAARLAETELAVRELNSNAAILTTQHGRIRWDAILSRGQSGAEAGKRSQVPDFSSVELHVPPLTRGELDTLFSNMRRQMYGHVYRAKGVLLIDRVPSHVSYADGRWTSEPSRAGLTSLVIVGRLLDISQWPWKNAD